MYDNKLIINLFTKSRIVKGDGKLKLIEDIETRVRPNMREILIT